MNRSGAPSNQRTLATRILLSFAVTLVAFAVTVGFSALSQKRTAGDSDELTRGYVPVALKLGQLRSVQSTLASLVDGIPDERNPLSMRVLLETLTGVRHAIFDDTRTSLELLREIGRGETKAAALAYTGELDATRATFANDRASMDRLFSSLDVGSRDEANAELVLLGAMEHDGAKRLRILAESVDRSMVALSTAARDRERRAYAELTFLVALTLAVGVAVAVHTRRLLKPLERVTRRARAVAMGDLAPQAVESRDDEIGALAVAFEQMVSSVGTAQRRAVANERLAAIGKMAAHVTHEIRNPLSSIGLNLELLEEELHATNVSVEARALVDAISREVQRLEQLSEEYLRVARLPQPRMEAEDVVTVVEDVVRFVRAEMETQNVRLTFASEGALPPVVFDESQIRQALFNVLRNAREAMPCGGELSVAIRAEGMSVTLCVDDRGPGIPEELLPRIFEPFVSTKGEGTGLGLAIAKQIMEAHGGSVSCAPRPGGGTSFRLLFPIAPRLRT